MEDVMFSIMVMVIVIASLCYHGFKLKVNAGVKMKEIELEREKLSQKKEDVVEEIPGTK